MVGLIIKARMKNTAILSLFSSAILLSGCTTEMGPDGRPRSVMTPMGAAAVQAVSAAGIGAGTGIALQMQPEVQTVQARVSYGFNFLK